MWLEIAAGAILLGQFVYHRWFEEKPKPKPASDANLPRTDEGAPLPMIYGRCRVRAPVLAWAGNWNPLPFSDAGIVLGYAYYLDMMFVIGTPFYNGATTLHTVFAGDYKIPTISFHQVTQPDYITQFVASNYILGGPGKGGSIAGQIEFFSGTLTQQIIGVNALTQPHLVSAGVDATLVPGYRGQAVATFYNWTIGESPNMTSYSFEVSSFSTAGLGPHLPADADPASVIYDLITNPFKLKTPTSKVDLASFTAASATLYAEAHGYSRSIELTEDARTSIDDVLRQIDAVLYEEPSTGKYVLKLIRNDYVLASCPEVNVDNCVGLTNYSNNGFRDSMNQVRVAFVDRDANYGDGSEIAQNPANAVGQDGRLRSTEFRFQGCCSRTLASSLAARELSVISRPMVKCTATVNRSFYLARPGDVVRLTWPEYNINQLAMRIARVDLGQLGAGKITLDLVQDVFDSTAGGFGGATTPPTAIVPFPITRRVFGESPRWLQWYAYAFGLNSSPDVQRVLAAATPDDAAVSWREDTALLPSVAGLVPAFFPDVPSTGFARWARVAVAYSRALDPYDTATGLVVDSPSVSMVGLAANPVSDIQYAGSGLVLVDGEFMAYESATDLGGGQYRLNSVWRGLLDTSAKDHAVGASVFWIFTSNVGTRGWPYNKKVDGSPVPVRGTATGSGGDPVDLITTAARSALPVRVANLAIGGKDLVGTQGAPASAGLYKAVSLLDAAVDVTALRRDRLSTSIVRGDAVDEAQNEAGVTYLVEAVSVASGTTVLLDTIGNTPTAGGGIAIGGGQAYLLGGAGHGAIDVRVTTTRTVAAADANISVPIGTVMKCIDPAVVRVSAPRWRNLLANGRFDYGDLRRWNDVAPSGTPAVGNDANSLRRDATGFYLKATSAAKCTVKQIVDVSGYLPRKMQAQVSYYHRNLNADASDTTTITIDALDSSGVSLGVSATTTLTPSVGNYSRVFLTTSAALPATTAKVAVQIDLNEVAGGGTAAPDSVASEFELMVGTFTYDVLSNRSFESIITGSWTVDSGSWVQDTTIPGPSPTAARGGPNATNVLHQDYALPAGWEFGSAVMKGWRAQTLAGDAGTITIAYLDVSNVVLASATTSSEQMASLNVWYPRRLDVNSPTTGLATKVRVTLTALRSAGAGNSGALFDDLVLTVHKHLASTYTRALEYGTPTVQAMPQTWQQWHLAYPALVRAGVTHPAVFGSAGALPCEMTWADGAPHQFQRLTALLGGGASSVNGFTFLRASGGAAVDFVASGISAFGTQAFAAPTSARSFTAIAYVRVDELGFAVACGIMGRRDTLTGWGLSIDATGHVVASLVGSVGNKVATTSTTVHDGALHMAVIVYDAVAQTLTAYDERGGSTTSTAAGLGEIAAPLPSATFRLGRSRSTEDTLPGMLANPIYFDGVALSPAQVAAHWNYAKDPTGLAPTYTRTIAAWVPGAPDAFGDTLAVLAADQVATSYTSALVADGGTGWGLATVRATTNLIPTFDLGDATKWVKDASAVLSTKLTDATGMPLGVTLTTDATNGLYVQSLAMTATTTLAFVFYAQADTGTPSVTVELRNASGVLKDSHAVVVAGAAWRRYTVAFTGWDNSTPTARVRLRSTAGTVAFGLSHVCFAAQGTEVPWVIPPALAAIGDSYVELADATITAQLNAEGELLATGAATVSAPGASSIAEVSNGTDRNNLRELRVMGAAQPNLDHYDAVTPTNVNSLGATFDWSAVWTVRGRWCSIGTLDNASNPFAGVVAPATAVYGRAATWTYNTTSNVRIRVGVGASSAINAVVRRVVVAAREPKLA